MTAMEEGRLANRAGVKARKVPYTDPSLRAAWSRGWHEAERERSPDRPL